MLAPDGKNTQSIAIKSLFMIRPRMLVRGEGCSFLRSGEVPRIEKLSMISRREWRFEEGGLFEIGDFDSLRLKMLGLG